MAPASNMLPQEWDAEEKQALADLLSAAGKLEKVQDRRRAAEALAPAAFQASGIKPSRLKADMDKAAPEKQQKIWSGILKSGTIADAIRDLEQTPAKTEAAPAEGTGTPVPPYKESAADYADGMPRPRIPGPVADEPGQADIERRVRKIAAGRNETKRKQELRAGALQLHDIKFRNMYASPEISQNLTREQMFKRHSVIDDAAAGDDDERRRLARMTDAEIDLELERKDAIMSMTRGRQGGEARAKQLQGMKTSDLLNEFKADDSAHALYRAGREQRKARVQKNMAVNQIAMETEIAAQDKTGRLARDLVKEGRKASEIKADTEKRKTVDGLRGITETASIMASTGLNVEVDEALGPEPRRDYGALSELVEMQSRRLEKMKQPERPLPEPKFKYPQLQSDDLKNSFNLGPETGTEPGKPGTESPKTGTEQEQQVKRDLDRAEKEARMPEAPAAKRAREKEERDRARTARAETREKTRQEGIYERVGDAAGYIDDSKSKLTEKEVMGNIGEASGLQTNAEKEWRRITEDKKSSTTVMTMIGNLAKKPVADDRLERAMEELQIRTRDLTARVNEGLPLDQVMP